VYHIIQGFLTALNNASNAECMVEQTSMFRARLLILCPRIWSEISAVDWSVLVHSDI